MNGLRLQYIDIIKGFAIILVVLAHLIQMNTINGIHNVVFQFINSFHMPLFFFASGYIAFKVCKIENVGGWYLFVINKMRSLILPLIVWTLVVNRYFLSSTWTPLCTNEFVVCLTKPGLWFLLTLFQISVMFGVLHLLSKRFGSKWSIDALMSILIIALLIILHEMSLALYSIFYFIGVFVAKFRKIQCVCQSEITVAIATSIFFTLVVHWKIDGSYIDDALKCIIAPCSFIMAYYFSKLGERTWIGNRLASIGQHSLAVYIIHWNLLKIIADYQIDLSLLNPFWLFIIMLVVAVVITYITVAISKLITYNKYLSFFMLGKKLK